jgi:drug/metabolite transporter (DMT)-like permease
MSRIIAVLLGLLGCYFLFGMTFANDMPNSLTYLLVMLFLAIVSFIAAYALWQNTSKKKHNTSKHKKIVF